VREAIKSSCFNKDFYEANVGLKRVTSINGGLLDYNDNVSGLGGVVTNQ
jgi:hypothetical protein